MSKYEVESGNNRPVANLILPAIFMGVGALWMVFSWQIGLFGRTSVASGFMPFVYGGAFSVASLAVLIIEWMKPISYDRPGLKPMLILVLVVGAVLLFPVLGGYSALFLLMLVLFAGVERASLPTSIAVSLVVTGCFWLAFSFWLRIQVPTGPLGF